jgi:hypothetical protein
VEKHVNLRGVVNFKDEGMLLNVIQHNIVLYVLLTVSFSIVLFIAGGPPKLVGWSLLEEFITAYLGTIPLAVMSYFTNRLYPNNDISFKEWVIFYFILLNNIAYSIMFIIAVPVLFPLMIIKQDHEYDYASVTSAIAPSTNAGDSGLYTLMLLIFICIVIVSTKRFLNITRKDCLVHFMVAGYIVIPVSILKWIFGLTWSGLYGKFTSEINYWFSVFNSLLF